MSALQLQNNQNWQGSGFSVYGQGLGFAQPQDSPSSWSALACGVWGLGLKVPNGEYLKGAGLNLGLWDMRGRKTLRHFRVFWQLRVGFGAQGVWFRMVNF